MEELADLIITNALWFVFYQTMIVSCCVERNEIKNVFPILNFQQTEVNYF